jgi:AraC-like DNA-binding protein
VYEIATIVGVIQSLFGLVIFITKRPTHISFLFLAAWFAVIAIFLGSFLLSFEVVDYFKPGIFPVLFLLGPLLYFYVSSLIVENFKLKFKHLLHLVPLFAVSIHRSTTSVVPIMSAAENPLFVYNKVYYFLFVVSLIFYWLISLLIILKFRKKIPLHFSNYTRNNSLTWLLFVLTFFLLFFVVDFVRQFLRMAWDIEITSFLLLPLNLTAFVFIMIFFGINQTVIYRSTPRRLIVDMPIEDTNGAESKYTRSAIHDDEVKALNEKIVNYLNKKKSFLNPDFNLEMMAADLDISRHKLSQVINSGQNKNFHKLINEYRISEVKNMLVDPSYGHFSVLGVAYECGFNSKSAFNRIFKEETGLTPREFKRSG